MTVSCLAVCSRCVWHLTLAARDERRRTGGGQGIDGHDADEYALAGYRLARGQWAPRVRMRASVPAQLLLSYPGF